MYRPLLQSRRGRRALIVGWQQLPSVNILRKPLEPGTSMEVGKGSAVGSFRVAKMSLFTSRSGGSNAKGPWTQCGHRSSAYSTNSLTGSRTWRVAGHWRSLWYLVWYAPHRGHSGSSSSAHLDRPAAEQKPPTTCRAITACSNAGSWAKSRPVVSGSGGGTLDKPLRWDTAADTLRAQAR